MVVRAKMRCGLITEHQSGSRQVFLSAVYDPNPESENYSWSKHTPSGEVKMFITNEAAFEQFEEGEEYYVDFTPVGRGKAAR